MISGDKQLPKGWEVKKLGEACIVARGSSPRPIKKYLTQDQNGVNWIKIGDTKNIEKYIYRTNQKITIEGAKKSRFVEKGDFILSNSMSFGRPYIMKTTGYIHDGWFKLKLYDFLNTEYFYQLLSSPYVNDQFHSLASGSVVKNISGDLVKKVSLPIPPLPEQKRIVSILDKAFKAINLAKTNAEQNLKNAKELFESYLYNIFENKGDDWVEKKLGEVCEIQLGKTPYRKTQSFWDRDKETSNVWLSIADMKHGEELFDSKEYISDLGVKNIKYVPKDTLMLSFKLTLGRVSFSGKDLFTNEAIASLVKLSPKVDKKFLFYYFSFFDWHKETEGDQKVKGRTLNKEKLKSLSIIVPPLPEQKQIVKKLDALQTQTKKLETLYQQKINNLVELKKSVLQKAFAGELT